MIRTWAGFMSIECQIAESELIQTGIFGLDQIFLGGILKGNLIVVEGAAGTGKTLMGVEFIYRGIVEQDEPGIIVVFESSPRNLTRDAMSFGWNLDELQQQNKLRIIFTSPQVLDQDLRSPDSLLLEAAAEIGAQRIFIDGISLLRRPTVGKETSDRADVSYRDYRLCKCIPVKEVVEKTRPVRGDPGSRKRDPVLQL